MATGTMRNIVRRLARAVPILLLAGGVVSAGNVPTATAAGSGSVSPNAVSGASPTVTVSWAGLTANDTVFIQQCWRTESAATFDPLKDCSQATYQNYPTGASGSGSKPFKLFGGNDPNGENWGCGPNATAVIKADPCFVRLTTGVPSNTTDDQFFAVNFGGGSGLTPLSAPGRLMDTRSGGATVDGQNQGEGKRAAGSTYTLHVAGRAGVASTASSVVLNVTAVEPDASGYITVFPCGTLPNASSLNYAQGAVIPNAVVATLSSSGDICLFTFATTHILVDVSGYFPNTNALKPLNAPARLLDTRVGATTIDGQNQGEGKRAAGSTYTLHVTGRAGVASGAASVVLNVTVVNPDAGGYITVFPCGTLPNASNLNYAQGSVIPNAVIATVSSSGNVCLFTYAATDILVDVSGYFADTTALNPLTAPARLMDTRQGATTIDGQNQGEGKRAAGSTYTLKVTGRAGVSSGAASVVLNVTAVDPDGSGFVTVYPCGTLPNASNLNYVQGSVIPNSVIATVSAGGNVCLYTFASTHLLVDVSGYFF